MTILTFITWLHFSSNSTCYVCFPVHWILGKIEYRNIRISFCIKYLTLKLLEVFPPYLQEHQFFHKFQQITISKMFLLALCASFFPLVLYHCINLFLKEDCCTFIPKELQKTYIYDFQEVLARIYDLHHTILVPYSNSI